jgi:hypothetical protein
MTSTVIEQKDPGSDLVIGVPAALSLADPNTFSCFDKEPKIDKLKLVIIN